MRRRQKTLLVILISVEIALLAIAVLLFAPMARAWLPLTSYLTNTPDTPESAPTSPASVQDTPIQTESVPQPDSIVAVATPETSTNFGEAPPSNINIQPSTSDTLDDPFTFLTHLPENFTNTPAIWAHSVTTDTYETVLFRQAFEVTQAPDAAILQIFADTRYEVWLDGKWFGRGPARFSCTLREYDVYPFILRPGKHTIAVLVQWAPNTRRSESSSPLLQARILGTTANIPEIYLQTDPSWKTLTPISWQPEADPVHIWGLIGPTELIDLRSLPDNWMQPEFVDDTWAKAVETRPFANLWLNRKNPLLQNCLKRGGINALDPNSSPTYQPRTIDFLENTPIIPKLRDAGLLSPDRLIIEPSPRQNAHEFSFNALRPTVFSMEVLASSDSTTLTNTIFLDRQPLIWLPAGEHRPDVYVGLAAVQAGVHTLYNADLSAYPIFSVFTDGLDLNVAPLQQGTYPGQRLLLGEPVSDPKAIKILNGPGLSVRLPQTPAYLVLEFDRAVYGRVNAEVYGPPGTIIDMGWDERLYDNTRPLPYPGSFHPYWNQTDSWVLDGNYRDISTIDARTGRYILIAVWGDGPVEIRNIRVLEEHYPVTKRGEFESSDELLNKIWQIGVDTIEINMTDAYADPWRERGQWWGDAYVVDRANRVSFGDTDLLRRGLLFLADGFENGRPIAFAPNGQGNYMLDYGMLWVQSLDAYIALTQDLSILEDVYPTLLAFMQYLNNRQSLETGMLNIPVAHWSQSNYIDTRASYSRWGQSAAVNAMYYGTLQSAAHIAAWLSDTNSEEKWLAQAARVKVSLNDRLYLPDEGRYATTLLSGELYAPDPFAQAWPLAYGLVPESEQAHVIQALRELLSNDPRKPNVDIYGMNWVFEGLGRTGHLSEALDIMQTYYGYLIDAGATTWWETFAADQYFQNAFTHGWGSSPTWFLTTYILGAQWTGEDTWVVRPAFEQVSQVSGKIPVHSGEVSISWTQQNCGLFTLDIIAPELSTGEVIFPFTEIKALWLNDQEIMDSDGLAGVDLSIEADGFHFPITEAGSYHFQVETICR